MTQKEDKPETLYSEPRYVSGSDCYFTKRRTFSDFVLWQHGRLPVMSRKNLQLWLDIFERASTTLQSFGFISPPASLQS